MTYTPDAILTISLNTEKHKIARQFALDQDTTQKGKHVYLNTLAVLAVHSFLDWLGIENDLETSDSWNPAVRCFHNVADLVVPNIGKIECRPVLPGETIISLPVEVTEDRIAYVGVQFQEQLNEVQLLGFCRTLDSETTTETIEIASLEPIETLIDYIDRLESAKLFLQSDDAVAIKVRERLIDQPLPAIIAQLERVDRTYDKDDRQSAVVDILANFVILEPIDQITTVSIDQAGLNIAQATELEELQELTEELLNKLDEIWLNEDIEYLRHWLEGIYREDWQAEEKILVFARNKDASEQVSRAKLIQLGENVVALLVSVISEVESEFDIQFRLYPAGKSDSLPNGLKITIIDEDQDILYEREIVNQKQAEIKVPRCEPGYYFDLVLAIGDIIVTENFGI
jgi:hypothetical protein